MNPELTYIIRIYDITGFCAYIIVFFYIISLEKHNDEERKRFLYQHSQINKALEFACNECLKSL